MGRRKSYDRDEVLQKATRLFWERGFHATSTRELTETMGVNVYSLYAEFGSKEGLYEAALRHYDDTVVTGHFLRLEAPGAGLDAVRAVLRFFGSAAREDTPRLGCLITNAVTELAPNEASSQRSGARYIERLSGAFEHALGNAVAAGALRPGTPVTDLARFLTVTLLGVFVLLRAGADHRVMLDTTEQALARVEGFAVTSSDLRAGP